MAQIAVLFPPPSILCRKAFWSRKGFVSQCVPPSVSHKEETDPAELQREEFQLDTRAIIRKKRHSETTERESKEEEVFLLFLSIFLPRSGHKIFCIGKWTHPYLYYGITLDHGPLF
jgi:hypothetical protein